MAATGSVRMADPDVKVVVAEPRAIISWGSILAGTLIAFAVLVLLTVTALAAGLEVTQISEGAEPRFGTVGAALVTGLFVVIPFGVGGLVAVWAAGLVEPGPAILHGFLVWAFALLLMLVLVAMGLGGLGATASFLGPGFEPESLEAFEAAGWATALALVLGAASAVLGALLATREEISRVW